MPSPSFPFVHAGTPNVEGSRREQLAKWITSKDNPYFAKSYVNRLWSYLLGVGIIEPVDDIRAGNPPTNPQLARQADRGIHQEQLQRAAADQDDLQVAHLSALHRHQPSGTRTTTSTTRTAIARRLPAEVLFDAIHRVDRVAVEDPGAAGRVAGGDDGRFQRQGAGRLPGGPGPAAARKCLRMRTLQRDAARPGPEPSSPARSLNNALKDPNNRIAKIVAAEKDDAKAVEEIFLAILNRRPTAKEIEDRRRSALQGNEDEFAKLVAVSKKHGEAVAAYEKQMPADRRPLRGNRDAAPRCGRRWSRPTMKSLGKAVLTKQKDLSILVSGPNASPETYTLTFDTKMADITGIRLEVLPDKSLAQARARPGARTAISS